MNNNRTERPHERRDDRRHERPHGLWDSAVDPVVLAEQGRLGDVAWYVPKTADDDTAATDNGPRLLWLENRSGRGVLMMSDPDGHAPRRLTTTLNVRGRVGYGGGEFTVAQHDVYFAADGGRLYRQPLTSGEARPITPAFGAAAAPAVSPDGRYVAYVHTAEGEDTIAVVDSEGRTWPQKLITGADFYMQPTWHPDGRRIAYIAWDHPRMPWDGTHLYVATLAGASNEDSDPPRLRQIATVAGGENVSIFQPEFSPCGNYLAYVSDADGWWQIYLHDLNTERHTKLTPDAAEHGIPAWVQGMRTYAFAPDGRAVYYIRNEEGFHRLWRCRWDGSVGDGLQRVNEPVPGVFDNYTALAQIAVASVPVQIACIAAAPDKPDRIITGTVVSNGADAPTDDGRPGAGVGAGRILRHSLDVRFPPGTWSTPKPIRWAAPDGTTVHALHYPPANPRFTAPGLPPAVINVHSGPTSQALPEFYARAQFFTSRGYSFIDVNYRGSTGYGRAYRNMLRGQWGVVDVEDAAGAARHAVDAGLADAQRLIIMGSSAGGYTVLRALVEHPGLFRAGLCLYAVADLFGLATDTHKFEQHYTDSLVGSLPEAAAVYRERSPVFHADKIRDPVAIFQGADDPVVPRAQADDIVATLQRHGVPHEYHLYEGEGHGFRRAETIAAFYTAIDKFLRRHVIAR